ncbi:acyltransferase [Pseudomonas sp. PDM15]|uniref:acyltransferase family protein n=1 Tax=Pseudomonas sp. PDM15 TaxID=2769303 RepID=UPI0017827AEC|nr:acyltransferase [Pseudomonas sp. PDM15]MBD9426162.1 acyltransferase [Pseudomonas sp. PDM15]
MLGILRFVLALMVLLSHIPGLGMPLNPGVSAVILFYFISGYLMGRSYQRFQRHSTQPIRDFYFDRLLKLMPQYSVVVLLTFLLIYWLGPAQHTMFLNQPVEPLKILLNLALLPANYVFEPLSITTLLPHPIVPPAWSLSSEFHFYLLLPLILLLGRWGFALVSAGAAVIQIAALFHATGEFNSDNFGYRFIFGVLVFFLAGLAYGRREEVFYRRIVQAYLVTYLLMLLVVAPSLGLYAKPRVQELLLGAVVALPLLSASLHARSAADWQQRLDELLGRLAYPIFISHFLVFFCCEKLLGLTLAKDGGGFVLASILGSLAASLLLIRLQAQVERYRIARRGFESMAPHATP